jgi:hypothetical protein
MTDTEPAHRRRRKSGYQPDAVSTHPDGIKFVRNCGSKINVWTRRMDLNDLPAASHAAVARWRLRKTRQALFIRVRM